MKISELFYSLQGEGKRTGVPSFFIRTNYCNLRCRFTSGNYCDTPYTSWNPDDNENLGDVEVEKIIDEFIKSGAGDVVITGGEPAIQKEELTLLCRRLKESGACITLETNGTVISDFKNYLDLASISPKLSSSVPYSTVNEKPHDKNRINPLVLQEYEKGFRDKLFDIQWKFVVCSEQDIGEIKELQRSIGFSNRSVFLMPEGISRDDMITNSPDVARLCLKHGYNYSGRLHVELWGGKRGV